MEGGEIGWANTEPNYNALRAEMMKERETKQNKKFNIRRCAALGKWEKCWIVKIKGNIILVPYAFFLINLLCLCENPHTSFNGMEI